MPVADNLTDALVASLAAELGDPATAAALARAIADDALSWRPPAVPAQQIATILGFTFGNRMQPNGNRTPGPVNGALGDLTVRLHRDTGAPVYAQWEVAEAIGKRIAADRLTAIYPAQDERAEPIYLSTSAVVAEVVRRVGDPAALGTVGIVAFADHAWRCVTTARRFGLAAAVPAGYAMPDAYDPLSGQPWCASRLAYLLHDIAIRVAERRDGLMSGSG